MKLRTLIVIVAVLAALSVVAYVKNRPESAPVADARVGTPLLSPDIVSQASGLTVSDQGKKVEVRKGADGTWRVTSYYGMPADFHKISQLVQDLNEAKVERFVTDNPDRLSRLEFKDSRIALSDAAGKEIWSVTLGKTPDAGNGKFIRFGDEPKAFFSGTHVWLETDPKIWADPTLVGLKPDDIAKVGLPLAGGMVDLSRDKKDAAWTATGGPAGQKLVADKVQSVLTTLTDLKFSDTLAKDDPAAREASAFAKTYSLTTFDGRTFTLSLGRKPEVKKLKAPVADADALKPGADGKLDAKPITPEYDTTPAGPVFAVISCSDPKAAINELMTKRSFEVDDYAYTSLPQKAEDLFQAEKAK
ncbi:MAG TPA: DUF4340 domain-containing protein [Opitutaceae bacterium]|jgi:hypothetical protein|nr:DUF4340 domain-containing protein [Opitutaceae bacterium]